MALVVVSYDIADDRRRRRIFKLMKDYGVRVQYSVFECLLDEALLRELRDKVRGLMNRTEDGVRYYSICGACRKTALIDGCGGNVEEDTVYVV